MTNDDFFENVRSDEKLEIVNEMINDGSDVNSVDQYTWTPLMLSSRLKQIKMVELLLDRGANVNAQTDEGWTALMYASENGFTEIVKLLLNRGADVNLKAGRWSLYYLLQL